MISIGNDIVDLTAIDRHRTQQKAFYSKILSDKEQQLYSRSSSAKQLPFEIFVWLLWSAKESVYKFAKRNDPDLVFSPARIVIQSIFEPEFSELEDFQNSTLEEIGFASVSTFNLEINHKGNVYYSRSCIFNDLIATFTGDKPHLEHIQWGIKKIHSSDAASQSAAVRAFLLQRLNERFPNKADFTINKSLVGYPVILDGQNQTDLKVSFAHHGHYVAYAIGV
ncbi:4'-phosphopantetheinyl transferase family protein [Mucilaginibacter polytrichastri]|uniref:4'-phosphopantetheinyl transferase domain-containing protein n=1 Tax=Mucilaginibacter polytrichastri TaxID=1302689 RepID=A0A1Q6A4G7_9SPHI|nr:4'-phosphopantetheinyl transferase superfamily protein [Mucilaginibacter polytrichastri]OKS88887.1 hypothetical protein RG47T_4365 [Mucilaginibacter polytrichastri]SFT06977.1 4'-phosphopantetheinyl transferase superfamily protein [Mucilaginibacter polytrichastri]